MRHTTKAVEMERGQVVESMGGGRRRFITTNTVGGLIGRRRGGRGEAL